MPNKNSILSFAEALFDILDFDHFLVQTKTEKEVLQLKTEMVEKDTTIQATGSKEKLSKLPSVIIKN